MSSTARYNLVPETLRERLVHASVSGPSFSVERFPAVAMIADVAGFTALVERYSARGPDAVEELSRTINIHFGCMVDVIAAYGGDIVRFAGDAPIAVFMPERGIARSNQESLREPVVRAAACSLALHRALRQLPAPDTTIITRIGIGAGEVAAIVTGGVDGRWEFVLGGRPLMQMAAAQRVAVMGDTVLSPDAAAAARDDLEGDRSDSGDLSVHGLRAPLASFSRPNGQVDFDDQLVAPFVPRSVTRFLNAGQAAWAAEFRRVSVLFLNILGIDLESATGPFRLDLAFRGLQAVVCEHGGSIIQFLNDDKGLTLLSAWGVQGDTHEDDAARVVRCGLAARARLRHEGFASRVGIATGRIFCGWRGNQLRREYALMGTTVNRGARLMIASSNDVRCDLPTVRAAGTTCRFEDAGDLLMKGGGQSIAMFRPLDSRTHGRMLEVDTAGRRIVGRQRETDILRDVLNALARGVGGTVLIRGPAGVGKSALLSDFLAEAAASRVITAVGAGVSHGTLEPYLAWRSVLSRILELDLDDETRRSAQLVASLRRHSGLVEWTPLLAEVLGIAMPDNHLTQQLSENRRAEKIRDLVVKLLNESAAAAAAPLAIVLDSVQWLDSLSVGLTRAACRRVSRILIVLTTRLNDHDTAPDLAEIADWPSTRTLDLGPLNRLEVRSLICQRLGVTHVPDALSAMVDGKSGGFPLFVGELVSALLESRVIRISGSACVLVSGENELDTQHVPESVQGAVAARLDRLDAEEQLTLKVASVLGSEFEVRTLAAVHPLTSPTKLGDTLQALEARGLIKSTVGRPDVYEFGHAVIQDVAYTTLSSEQRRSLHHAIAEWYERTSGIESPPTRIAHHWTCAEERSKSLDWLERAGMDAAHKGAAAETRRHFRRALDIGDRVDAAPVDTLRRIRWFRYLAFASAELGDVDGSVQLLRTALHLLGKRLPQSRPGLSLRLAKEILIQAARLAHLVRTPARVSAPKRDMLLEQAEIHRLLGRAAFFAQDHLTYITASLAAINLAERTGAHDTAASAYAALAYIVAMLGLRRLAERWWKLADESDQPGAKLDVIMGQMMFLNSHARWEESARLVSTQAQMIERIGSSTSMPLHQIIRFYLNLHRGELDAARASATAYLDWALSQNNIQEGLSGHVHLILVDLLQGRATDAARRLRDAEALASRVATPMYRIMFLGLRVDAKREAGNLDAAAQDAQMLQQLLDQTPSYIGGEMSGYVALTEYFIARWRQADKVAAKVARSHALRAYRTLKKHARLNPYARPRRWLLDAEIAASEKRFGRARRSRRRALELANRYHMSRESADAHLGLALDAALPAETRASHLYAARDIFAKMGCLPHVQRIDESLSHFGTHTT